MSFKLKSGGRERIAFEQKVRQEDAYGGYEVTWARPSPPNDKRFATVSVRGLFSREDQIAGAATPVHRLRFVIRYDLTFWDLIKTGEWRLIYRSMIFDVEGALPDTHNRHIEIHGKLYVNEG